VTRVEGQSSVAMNMFANAGPEHQVTNAEQVLCALKALPCAFRDLILFIEIVLTVPVSSAKCRAQFFDNETCKDLLEIHYVRTTA
jgi:hypothetical protein